jgi:hypothetical protein
MTNTYLSITELGFSTPRGLVYSPTHRLLREVPLLGVVLVSGDEQRVNVITTTGRSICQLPRQLLAKGAC